MSDDRPLVGTVHGLLRMVAGLLFWQHGAQKLLGILGGFGPEGGSVAFTSWPFGVAGTLEFFGGILIFLGVFTRPVALVLAAEMAVAYGWRHFPRDFWPILNGGERALLFCAVFLFLAAAGPGRLAVDRALRRRPGADEGPPPEGEPAGSPEAAEGGATG